MKMSSAPLKGPMAYALPLAVLAVIVIVWEALVRVDPSVVRPIPAPSDVWQAFLRTRETLFMQHIPQTLLETVIGVVIAIVLGLIVAAALDFSPLLKQAMYPLL